MGFLRDRREARKVLERARQIIDARRLPPGAYPPRLAPKPDHLDRLARQGCAEDGWIWPPLAQRRARRVLVSWPFWLIYSVCWLGLVVYILAEQ